MMPILFSNSRDKKNNYLKQGRDTKGRFMKNKQSRLKKFWKYIVKRYFEIFFLLTICILTGCATKYQVVSDLGSSTYHMHNIKRGKVEVITTEQKLEVGKWYNLKNLK